MTIEYKAKQGKYGSMEVTQSHIENFESRIALEMINKHGLLAGRPDGVDEAGRQKGALLTPHEVVQRAFDIAELAVKELANRGWLVEVEKKDE